MTHSRKILSQAGTSLADVYDVEGSVVGLEQLDVGDIKGVHDLGPTIHSERLQAFVIRMTTGAIAQNLTFDVMAGGMPDSINRVLGVFVLSDTPARLDFAQVGILGQGTQGEIPMWSWDSANDVELNVRLTVIGVVANRTAYQPPNPFVPQLLLRIGDPKLMPELSFRGQTLGFGGGTVTVQALVMIARPDPGAPAPGHPSSHGLPIPSW